MSDLILKLRKAQLKIAMEVKRICEKHDIAYFLDAGSMLGAVRHGGYIPWDDDVDIGMMDKDYVKFLAVAKEELGEEFFLDNYMTNPQNPLVFTKVRLKGTIYIEKKGNPHLLHNEIFVDIFPYYYISDNIAERRIEAFEMAFMAQILLSKAGYQVWRGERWTKRLKFVPVDIAAIFLPVTTVRKQIDRLFHKHDQTACVCAQGGAAYDYRYFPKEIFDEYIDIEFENIKFTIPKGYDCFLKKAYGDYMQLPPEDQRITHQISKLDLGEFEAEL